MGFFRRIAGILGFFKEDNHDHAEEVARAHGESSSGDRTEREEFQNHRPRKGFSMQVPVSVDRPAAGAGPVLVKCNFGDGGVQGLRWCATRLRIDEDGDVADEFLDEVLPEASGVEDQRQVQKFAIKYNTQPAKVRKQIMAVGGNIQQNVEYQGRLQWV